MPRIGMETIRRETLIRATIAEIGRVGSLDVTVGRIAARAGVSAALAHHYFGSKDQIFLAAMRHILREFGASVRERQRAATGPAARIRALVEASFSGEQFDRECVASWLAFYVLAQTAPEAARLLRVYARRLDSNLVHDLRPLVGEAEARRIAQGIASMIDGLYIRCALQDRAPDAEEAKRLTLDYLDLSLAACAARTRPAPGGAGAALPASSTAQGAPSPRTASDSRRLPAE
ncbi:transcriptional regulator BetI [Albimonas sp. CAU 1670]|uniref:transcriptional regulator BetI n=1 Tax=Albimonas sp. CAU 1670 TaxID=3032599 RepID=UPI0023D9972D|nr:transcriptional regulator BetI [Albimonas sp. CAU 1670]MDF2231840.1 transcriptional regulator BetI [Albimonas sp. CAU 1670]